MKKLSLLLACAAVGLMATAAEPNIFAYGIKVTPVEGTTFKVEYSLNAPATAAALEVVDAAGNSLKSVSLTSLAKGANAQDIDLAGVNGSDLIVKIKATGAANADGQWITDATQDSKLNLWSKGVYVINDMKSANFGNMLLAVPGNAPTGTGIHMYDPQLNEVGVYNGGLTFTGNAGPMRFGESGVAGKILLADWTDGANSSVWVMDANDMTKAYEPVFQGNRNDDGLISNDGVNVAGSCSGVVGINRGEGIDLYTVDEDITDADHAVKNIVYYSGVKYGTPWTAAPTAFLGNWEGQLVNMNAGLWPDGMGGIWICQNRWSNSSAYPSIMHLNSNNERDYVCTDASVLGGSTAGAFGLSCDYKTMAVAVNSGIIAILDVVFDPITGVPSLTQRTKITSPIGDTSTQFAFDVANNFYVSAYKSDKASNKNGIAMYAMPTTDNTSVVTAPMTISVSGIDGITAGQEATVVARYNAAGQQVSADARGMQIVRMSDGTVSKVIVK